PAGLSLAEQIAQLEDSTYVDFDPEDPLIVDEAGGLNTEGGNGREHYLDVGPSRLRKIHDSISDPKYDGVKVTRRQLMDTEEGIGSEDSSEEESEPEENSVPASSEGESDEGPETHQREPSMAIGLPEAEPKPVHDDETLTIQKARDSDKRKGVAVAHQIATWETLLDARIQLQKATNATGKLPIVSSQNLLAFRSRECTSALSAMLKEADELSRELIELQEDLLQKNDILTPPHKRRKLEPAADSLAALEGSLHDASRAASELEHNLHLYSIQTLNKWSAKVQAVTPSVLLPSNRNTFLKNGNHLKSVVELIDDNLVDKEKLLSRTRTKRSKSLRLDSLEEQETHGEDVELFDDTDFYHQLLRDVIDSREDGTHGSGNWVAAQRQRKEQKTVDTKASKGRRLRYEVHEKIQNFMVPVPVAGSWHEEQIDELFSSLLGKGPTAAQVEPHVSSVVQEVLKDGFRVFG
ncbi:TRAUB-domain-containing protein, partial [Pluteus cervinus]